jgi:hypothetical protein
VDTKTAISDPALFFDSDIDVDLSSPQQAARNALASAVHIAKKEARQISSSTIRQACPGYQ